jgi:amino acid transporter/lipopolysaccharide biosynthesis regulator YciM
MAGHKNEPVGSDASGSPRALLSVADGVFLTAGMIIGVGIFKAPAIVAGNTSSTSEFLLVWLFGGVISLCGALVYAELASRHAGAGGEYTFLRLGLGRGVGFLFAWSRMTVIQTGAIAAVAFVFGEYATQVAPLGTYSIAIWAAIGVGALTLLNLIGTVQSKTLQKVMETLLIVSLLGIAVAGIAIDAPPPPPKPASGGALDFALLFVLFTYGGWNEAAYLGGEVRDPKRNMLKVLVLGIVLVTALYLVVCVGYLAALGLSGVAGSKAVAADVMRLVLGEKGVAVLAVVVCVSALTTINAAIFTGARTTYAMGQDFPAFRRLGAWRDAGSTPANALLLQGAITLVLIVAAAVSIWQSVRATQQRDRADEQAAVAQAVNDFVRNDLLAQASTSTQATPDTPPDPNLTVRTALDRAAARIEGKFPEQPLVEASIRETIGKTYMDLGLYEQAQQQLERDLQLRRSAVGDEQAAASEAMSTLADLLRRRAKYAEAEPLFVKALAAQRRVVGADDPRVAQTMNNLALVYADNGRYQEAESILREALDAQRRTRGEEHAETLSTANDLAIAHFQLERFDEAGAEFAKIVEIRTRTEGPEHPETLQAGQNLAAVHFTVGDFRKAAAEYERVATAQRRVLGPEHPQTLLTLQNLSNAFRALGRYADAERLTIDTVAARKRVLGEEHPLTLASLHSLAWVYQYEKRFTEADEIYVKILDARRRVLGPRHPETLIGWMMLTQVRLQQRRFAEAETLGQDLLAAYKEAAPDQWRRFYTETMVGESLVAQGKYAEAEPLLLSGHNGLVERRAKILPEQREPSINESIENLVSLYEKWGKPERAAEWRLKRPASATPNPAGP